MFNLGGNSVEPGLKSRVVVTIVDVGKTCELCASRCMCYLPTIYDSLATCHAESRVTIIRPFFCNILMIFQREYNRVPVPTPGWIEQNQ